MDIPRESHENDNGYELLAARRRAKLDETQACIDLAVSAGLVAFVRDFLGGIATVISAWHMWKCQWLHDAANLWIFLDCEGPEDNCYLLISYSPSVADLDGTDKPLRMIDQPTLIKLCDHLHEQTGLPARLG